MEIDTQDLGNGSQQVEGTTELVSTTGALGDLQVQAGTYAATGFVGQISNEAPTISDPGTINAPVNEDTDVSISAADADGDDTVFVVSVGPSNGVLTGTGPMFLYTPNASYAGADSIQVSVNDGADSSQTLTINFNVRSRRKILIWVQPEDATLQYVEIEELAVQAAYVTGVGSLFEDLDKTLDYTFAWVFGGSL